MSASRLILVGAIAALNLMLLLKLIEMGKCTLWAITKGSALVQTARQLGDLNAALGRLEYPFFPGAIVPTQIIAKLYASRLGRPVVALAFRHVVLTTICAAWVLSNVAPNAFGPKLRLLSSGLLILGAWLKVSMILVYRVKFGSLDNFLLGLSVPAMRARVADAISERISLQQFVFLYSSLFIVLITSYAAFYSTIATGAVAANHMKNMTPDSWVQSIYFSTATLCTVGFGDISPVGAIAQLVCITQMISSFLLLVVLVAAFSSTTQIKPKGGEI